jgi:hypothetical protein
MINEWKKVVNAIMIFECSTGELALCLCTSWLCRPNVIFIFDGNSHTDHKTLHRNLHLYDLKKQTKYREPFEGFH